MPQEEKSGRDSLLHRCVTAYVEVGSLELSLDQLAKRVGTSKRMLVHYFGSRECIEEKAMVSLEELLRAQFAPEIFRSKVGAKAVVAALWELTTAAEAKGVLLLVMDVSRRAWNGSERARAFYNEQQRLWAQLLMEYMADRSAIEEILQLFQGAVLAFLITGDPEPGRRALMQVFEREGTKAET